MDIYKYKILLISDDQNLFQMVGDIIQAGKIEAGLEQSVDYHNIIKAFNSNLYDITLVDSRIFSGKGLQVVKTSREQGCDSAIIYIENDNHNNIEHALEMGVTAYLLQEELESHLAYSIKHSYHFNTALKKTRVQDKYLRILSQGQPVGMLLVTEDLTVKMANNFALYMSGSACKSIQGYTIGKIIKCSNEPECGCQNSGQDCSSESELTRCIAEVFKSGRGFLYREMELHFSDSKYNSRMWARVSVKPVFIDGVKHAVVTIDDLTQRHEMELLLQKAQQKARENHIKMKDMNNQLQQIVAQTNVMVQEAFAANKAKNDFMANISHELRTPLNGIQGFCQLLLEEQLSGQQQDYAQTIYSCTKDLIRVLNNVLGFTRLEKNNICMIREWFNVDDITDDLVVMYNDTALSKGLEFEINKTASCPTQIRSDQPKLKQSLFNIVENAIKYTSAGKVTITISGMNYDGNDCVRFDIIDTGIGMSEDVREKIFDSFSQVDTSATRKFDGLGLGLTVAKRYVTLLGGQIELESVEGFGSKFSVIVPVDKQIKKTRLSDRTFDSRKACGILIAECEPHHADILYRYLKQMKVHSEIVLDGSEAVEKIANNKYYFVLLDLTLPQLRDESAIEVIREASHTMPIFALCDDKDKYSAELAKKLGCKSIMRKPVDKSKLDAITIEYCSVPEEVVEASLDTDAIDFFSHSDNQIGIASESANDEHDLFTSHSPDTSPIYSTLHGQEDMNDVIQTFINFLPKYMQDLKSALESGTAEDVFRTTFDLRDSAGAAGFPELRLAAMELEKAAMDKDMEKAKMLLPSVAAVVNRLAIAQQ